MIQEFHDQQQPSDSFDFDLSLETTEMHFRVLGWLRTARIN